MINIISNEWEIQNHTTLLSSLISDKSLLGTKLRIKEPMNYGSTPKPINHSKLIPYLNPTLKIMIN